MSFDLLGFYNTQIEPELTEQQRGRLAALGDWQSGLARLLQAQEAVLDAFEEDGLVPEEQEADQVSEDSFTFVNVPNVQEQAELGQNVSLGQAIELEANENVGNDGSPQVTGFTAVMKSIGDEGKSPRMVVNELNLSTTQIDLTVVDKPGLSVYDAASNSTTFRAELVCSQFGRPVLGIGTGLTKKEAQLAACYYFVNKYSLFKNVRSDKVKSEPDIVTVARWMGSGVFATDVSIIIGYFISKGMHKLLNSRTNIRSEMINAQYWANVIRDPNNTFTSVAIKAYSSNKLSDYGYLAFTYNRAFREWCLLAILKRFLVKYA